MIAVMRRAGGVRVKICGLRTLADVDAAAVAGAAYVGFVFFDKSPRCVDFETARRLALAAPSGLAKVALLVDPDDDALDAVTDVVPLDLLQLHGSESPTRVSAIRARTGLPVMKAIGLRDASDLEGLDAFAEVADQILVDAKPPDGASLPGGNGIGFDWTLLSERRWTCPWMLAGGLDTANVADAVRLTGARQVDVSSGVETSPGVKDRRLIAAFCDAAANARWVPAPCAVPGGGVSHDG